MCDIETEILSFGEIGFTVNDKLTTSDAVNDKGIVKINAVLFLWRRDHAYIYIYNPSFDFDEVVRATNELCCDWIYPDSKVHGANMGPIWGWQYPGGPHIGPINFAIWVMSSTEWPFILFSYCCLNVAAEYDHLECVFYCVTCLIFPAFRFV